MQRDEVLHACRAVTSHLGVVRLLALGSQAIHVLLEPEEVPEQVAGSMELDLVVLDVLPGQGDLANRSPAQSVKVRTSMSPTATTRTA
jgi:hypothetical protein